jgi:hypothetical protein
MTMHRIHLETLALVLLALACSRDHESTAAAGGTGTNANGSGGAVSNADGGSTAAGGDTGTSAGGAATAGPTASNMSFFVSSQKSVTGNLGGLLGADERCQALAAAVGHGSQTWHAYLSVEQDPAGSGTPAHARDRIGAGPWHNSVGVLLANNLTDLHARTGDADVFLDEYGAKIPGQWPGSPAPVEHDVLTGSNPDGTVMPGLTCADWTSEAASFTAQVGHTDGLGPGANPNPPYASWNSSHANGGCNDTAPKGGAGRLYCFAVD